jgi:hypothetical protein
VIRLLIANLKSDESQAFLVEKLIEASENERRLMKSRLLGGLLLDGIEPAEFRKKEIFQYLLHYAIKIEKKEELIALLSMIRTCLSKENVNQSVMYKAFESIWQSLKGKNQKISIILTATSLNWSETKIRELTGDFLITSDPDIALYKFFFTAKPDPNNYQYQLKNIERLWLLLNHISLMSSYLNFVSAALQSIASSLDESYIKNSYDQQMVTLASPAKGPFFHFNMNSLYISSKAKNYSINYSPDRDRDRARARKKSSENFWSIILTTAELYEPLLDLLCIIFDMKPHALWWEVLRVSFLPKIPVRITLFDETKWKQVEQAFEKGNVGETEIYSAAWQLLFDSWLYIFGNHNTREESTFEHLAQSTQNNDEPPLRIAHYIRDLAYGDESQADDLVSIVKSNDPQYREIFERCLWVPTAEEKKKEQAPKKRKK